jgi:hypothetical protein
LYASYLLHSNSSPRETRGSAIVAAIALAAVVLADAADAQGTVPDFSIDGNAMYRKILRYVLQC